MGRLTGDQLATAGEQASLEMATEKGTTVAT